MAEHKSHDPSIHSEPPVQSQHPEPTIPQPPTRPSTHRRLSHAIQDLLFGHAKAHKHTIESQTDHLRPLNSTHNLKVEQKTVTTTTISLEPTTQDQSLTDSIPISQQTTRADEPADAEDLLTRTLTRTPSAEAHEQNTRNQNGFGDNANSKAEPEQDYGWPGLGTWPNTSHDSKSSQPNIQAQAQTQTQTQTHTTGPKRHDEKLEKVMRDAIDEAAGESYGWPGLGTWSSTPRRS